MRGDVFRLRSDRQARGREQKGARYAVVLQSSDVLLSTVIVAPTSTQAQPASFRPTISVQGQDTRLLVDQMAAVDLSRLGDLAGQVNGEEWDEIEQAVCLILDV